MADVSVISVLIKAKDEASKVLDDVQTKMGGMAAGFEKHRKSIGLGMTIVGGALTAISVSSIKAASDVEEMQGKFNTVFGELSKETEEWAKTHAKAANRNRFDLMEYASTLQDTFVPMGFARDRAAEFAKSVTELSVDLGSFNNLKTADVVRDMQSALVGNTETVRKYGVVLTAATVEQEILNQGWASSKNDITEAMKVQARMNLIIEGTADAQGDAIRTSGSFANQMLGLQASMKEAQVTLGQALLPAITALVSAITPVLISIGEWMKENEGLAKVLIIVGASLGVVMLVLGPMLLILPQLFAGMKLFAAGIRIVTAAMAANPIGAVIAVLTTLAVVVLPMVIRNWDSIFYRIKSITETVVNFIIGLLNDLTYIWQKQIQIILDVVSTLLELGSKLPFVGDKFKTAAEAVQGFSEKIKGGIPQINITAKKQEELKDAVEETATQFQSSGATIQAEQEAVAKSATTMAQTAVPALEGVAHAWGAVEDQMAESTKARIAQINEQNAKEETHAALIKLSADSRRSAFQKELDDFMAMKRHQGDVYDGMLDDASVYYEMVAQKAKDSADKVIAETHRATADQPHIGQGMRATAMAPYPGGPVLPVGSSFDHSGWNKFSEEQREKARMNWSGMSDKQLQQMFGSSQEAVRWAASQEQFKRGTAGSSFRPGNILSSESADWAKFEAAKLAQGGIVRHPTMALVGESGPEAVIPLGRGGGLGSTNIFHFHGAVYGVEDLREAVVEAVRDHAISGGFSGVFAEA